MGTYFQKFPFQDFKLVSKVCKMSFNILKKILIFYKKFHFVQWDPSYLHSSSTCILNK